MSDSQLKPTLHATGAGFHLVNRRSMVNSNVVLAAKFIEHDKRNLPLQSYAYLPIEPLRRIVRRFTLRPFSSFLTDCASYVYDNGT